MNKEIEDIENFLKKTYIAYKKDYKIKYETYFKMGGNVKLFISPNEFNQFKELIIFLKKINISFKIIGFTSNIILLDELKYFVIISTKNLTKLIVENNTIEVEAGYSLQDFVKVTVINQSKGFEGLEGIPASMGGAIFMNAGAYGDNISDNLISLECIDDNNNFITLKKDECDFQYRNSLFKKNNNYSIIRAKFQLNKGDRKNIQKKIEIFHSARHSYQDFTYPNLGSMISLTGDIYSKIIKKSLKYNLLYWILKYLYKNPISKFINRKRANNKVFNKLILNYLKKEKNINMEYILSSKNANILINDGTTSSKKIIDYIYLMHDLLDRKFHIENEIVLEPIYDISKDFEATYAYFIQQQEERK